MKAVLLVLAALLCLPPPGVGAAPANLRAAIAVLSLYDPEERRVVGMGTAFHVGAGLFYTNAHVILAGQRFTREEPKFRQWILTAADEFGSPRVLLGNAEVHCVDRRYQPDPYGEPQPFDVAVVRLTDPRTALPPALVIAQARVVAGQRVRVLGYPQSRVFFEMRGVVVEVRPERIVVEREPGGAVLPGSSGSPMFNAGDEVVGILQAGNVGRLLSLVVPIQTAVIGCPATP